MRLKKYIVFFLVMAVALNFSSCVIEESAKTETTKSEVKDKVGEGVAKAPSNHKATDVNSKNNSVVNPIPNNHEQMQNQEGAKEEPVVNPDTKKKEGDFSQYNNEKRSWWFRRAKDNQPSTTNPDVEEILGKYDGVFIHKTDQKVLYLTFDEGYENGYTPKILDTLKANNVPAAFFITAPYLKKHSDLVKRMVDEGHIVGNHSVTHPSMPDIKDDKKLEEEILGVERTFYEMFHKNMHYFRPPRGEYSEKTLAITQSLGYKTVFWSFAYRDWEVDNQKGADYAYETIMNGIHNGAILLLHAVSKDNAESLDKMIKEAKAKGYEFKSLDDIENVH